MLLSVVADDLGYCPDRNRGIIEAFRCGVITDASLMVNANYADDAVTLAQACNLPLGLHFNISEGKPVSASSELKSLVGPDDLFLGKIGIKVAAECGSISPDEVRKEFSAQINLFCKLTGSLPRRVDGHQHVHVLPIIREIFAEEMERNNIRLTRLPDDLSLTRSPWAASISPFLSDVIRNAKSSKPLFEQHGIRAADSFIGSTLMNYSGKANLTAENLLTVLSCLPSTAETCELMVHPGYPCVTSDGGCGQGPDTFSKEDGREWELLFLKSLEFKQILQQKEIELVSFERF